MLKHRQKTGYYKKYPPTMNSQPTHHLDHDSRNQVDRARYSSVESCYSKTPYLTEMSSNSSSRIAQENTNSNTHYQSFQASILKKVESIEGQTNQVLQKKERELYFMKIQLQNSHQRLRQTEDLLRLKEREIGQLKSEIKISQRKSYPYCSSESENWRIMANQNEKLRDSLNILIEEKNQNWRKQQRKDNTNNDQVQSLKKEVQKLQKMVNQMEEVVLRCPSCYTLKREKQELQQAYDCLLNEYSDLKKKKNEQQNSLLQNITQKIIENQNILRQNSHLRQQQKGKPYHYRARSEKTKEVVAKRCRTLTDNF